MNITTQKHPKGVFEIRVELSVAEIEGYVKKAAVKLSGTLDIQGFRKGSAPFEVVKSKVGEMALYQEGAALAIDDTLYKAVAQHKLHYVGQPEIKVEKLAPGNPFIYSATLALLPEVELPDFSKISVARKPIKIEDAEVTKVVDDLREMRATEVVVDRAAKLGDMVHVDFDVFKAKVLIEGGSGKKYPLVLGRGQMIPGFEDNLVGLKKDEAKEFQLKFPKDYPNKNLADSSCDFKVKVLEVFERTKPEVNLDFVKGFGDFTSVDDFNKLVRSNLEMEATRRQESHVELEVLEKVAEKSTIGEIPEVLLTSETGKMLEELRHNVGERGLKFEDYLLQIKKKVEDLMLDFAPEALRRVKFALIIRRVAEMEKLSATPEEIEVEVNEYKARFPGNKDVEKQVVAPEFRSYIANFIVNRKAVGELMKKVVK